MRKTDVGRRRFLKQTGVFALGAAGVMLPREGYAQGAVPNSAGTGSPTLKAPPNACDCHHHIYDAVAFCFQQGPRTVSCRTPAWMSINCCSEGFTLRGASS